MDRVEITAAIAALALIGFTAAGYFGNRVSSEIARSRIETISAQKPPVRTREIISVFDVDPVLTGSVGGTREPVRGKPR